MKKNPDELKRFTDPGIPGEEKPEDEGTAEGAGADEGGGETD